MPNPVHSHYGMHFTTRVPKCGRDLSYHFPSCDLFIVGSSHEAWRLNLERGTFLKSFETDLPEINTSTINPAHQLLAFGGSNGVVEFWDHRSKNRITTLDIGTSVVKSIDSSLLDTLPQCTSLAFDNDGLGMVVGTSTGQVVSYDLRRPTPLLLKDHQYGYPIKSLLYHSSGNVLSADTKICKIWNKSSGKVFTSVEAAHDINDICVFPNTGLLMMANEGVQMQSYYIPELGPAPKWCPFLENLTEELEETPDTVIYDDYKFVTKRELENLALQHLIGTNVLKAYMHGIYY
jgi:ribosome biogenesis protein ENP2